MSFQRLELGQGGRNKRIWWFARGQSSNNVELSLLKFYLHFSRQYYLHNQYIGGERGYESDWYCGVTRVVGKGYGKLDHITVS